MVIGGIHRLVAGGGANPQRPNPGIPLGSRERDGGANVFDLTRGILPTPGVALALPETPEIEHQCVQSRRG